MKCRSEVVPGILVQPGSRETADDAAMNERSRLLGLMPFRNRTGEIDHRQNREYERLHKGDENVQDNENGWK